jgi:hypothetical protein
MTTLQKVLHNEFKREFAALQPSARIHIEQGRAHAPVIQLLVAVCAMERKRHPDSRLILTRLAT